MTSDGRLKVLITGVYGLIGNLAYRHLSGQKDQYDVYGSGRRAVHSNRIDDTSILPVPVDHFTKADLADADAVKSAIQGMDAVIHLGAVPDPGASFTDVLNSNIIGTYNTLEACRELGIKRLIYASSVMVNWGYFMYEEPYKAIREGRAADIPASIPKLTIKHPVRPTEPYSASKVWGEGMCRTYADAHGISTVCLRIGWVNKQNAANGVYEQAIWFSHRDAVNVIELALKATEKPGFEICYGMTESPYRWVDIEHTHDRLGYVSQGR
ncbi:MAG: NAD(P)-dependent oxidoreductase [candidate division Zixibacteria bacterium]|nr:NAD(P)-dependent oxidoreductase [candidate division Zixibacteria bacterium]